MFTTGSKLLFGASALSLVTALVYAWSTEGALSSAGTLGLLSLFVIFALLGGVNYANRDCNVSSMDEAAVDTSAAAQRPGASSVWPAVVALGIAGLVVGAGPPEFGQRLRRAELVGRQLQQGLGAAVGPVFFAPLHAAVEQLQAFVVDFRAPELKQCDRIHFGDGY